MRRSRILHLIYINIERRFKNLLEININNQFNIAKGKKKGFYIAIYRISTTDFEIENARIYGEFDEKNNLPSTDIFFFQIFFAF
jgi:hypothetical protein